MCVPQVMALNMLIAQMSTTYERVRERLATNYMYISAMLTTTAMNEEHVPAPLRILATPYHIGALVVRGVHLASRLLISLLSWKRGDQFEELDEESIMVPTRQMSIEHARRSSVPVPPLLASGHSLILPEEGKPVDFKELQLAEGLLREGVNQMLDAGSGEAGALDDRWKARQSRQLGTIGADVHALSARVEQLSELQGLTRKTFDYVDRLAREGQKSKDEVAEHSALLKRIATKVGAPMPPPSAPSLVARASVKEVRL